MTMINETKGGAAHHTGNHGRKIAFLVLAVMCSAIALTWAWNTIANGLLQMPAAEFRHGFAASLAATTVAATLRLVWHWPRPQEQ